MPYCSINHEPIKTLSGYASVVLETFHDCNVTMTLDQVYFALSSNVNYNIFPGKQRERERETEEATTTNDSGGKAKDNFIHSCSNLHDTHETAHFSMSCSLCAAVVCEFSIFAFNHATECIIFLFLHDKSLEFSDYSIWHSSLDEYIVLMSELIVQNRH